MIGTRMKQALCRHNSTIPHVRLMPDGSHEKCPGPIVLKQLGPEETPESGAMGIDVQINKDPYIIQNGEIADGIG